MIAHVGGLPLEETLAQLAPAAFSMVVAVGFLRERARRWAPRTSVVAVIAAFGVTLAALVWSATALAKPGGNSAATIAGSFSDHCRDFTAHSSKDISHVELHYTDGRVSKDETVNDPAYAIDGTAGQELASAVVKSGTTSATFACRPTNETPIAILEIKTPPLSGCAFNDITEYPVCLVTEPRTDWSRAPDGALGFIITDRSQLSLTLELRGTSSTDADEDIASWSIDFGDGTSASGSWTTEPPAVMHTYPLYDAYNPIAIVTLTVTDSEGQSDSDTVALYVIDGIPD